VSFRSYNVRHRSAAKNNNVFEKQAFVLQFKKSLTSDEESALRRILNRTHAHTGLILDNQEGKYRQHTELPRTHTQKINICS